MELSGLVPLVRRSWRLLLASASLAGIGGYVAASQATVPFEAESRVLVGPINGDNDTLDAASRLTLTYAELATSETLLDATALALDSGVGSARLRRSLSVTADDVTRLITIRAESDDADTAADIANEVARQLTLLSPADADAPAGEVLVIDPANAPSGTPQPEILLYVGLATVLGALVALVSSAVSETASSLVRSPGQLRALTGWEVVTASGPTAGSDLQDAVSPAALEAASYRRIAAFVGERLRMRSARSVLVTGAKQSDDTARVAVGLAAMLAGSGQSVALVVAGEPGKLAELDFGGLNVWVQPAAWFDPARAMVDRRLAAELMGAIEADVVVVAAPPVNESSETLTWATLTDLVLMVLPLEQMTDSDVLDAAVALRVVNAAVDGAVAIQAPAGRRGLASLLRFDRARDDERARREPAPVATPQPFGASGSTTSRPSWGSLPAEPAGRVDRAAPWGSLPVVSAEHPGSSATPAGRDERAARGVSSSQAAESTAAGLPGDVAVAEGPTLVAPIAPTTSSVAPANGRDPRRGLDHDARPGLRQAELDDDLPGRAAREVELESDDAAGPVGSGDVQGRGSGDSD